MSRERGEVRSYGTGARKKFIRRYDTKITTLTIDKEREVKFGKTMKALGDQRGGERKGGVS